MKYSDILSILVLSILLISGTAIAVQENVDNEASNMNEKMSVKNPENPHVDVIDVEVKTSRYSAVEEVAVGELDVFLETISRGNYEHLSYSWKKKLNAWEDKGEYRTMMYNPAHTGSPYECRVDGELMFNPLSIDKVRLAQNYLFDRKDMVEDLYDGHAEPRYIWMGISSPGYNEFLKEIKEDYGITAEGDYEKGLDMVQEAMETAMNDPELKGSLRRCEDGFWEYKAPGGSWKDIEINGMTRIEDEREQIGVIQTNILQSCGFKVDNMIIDGRVAVDKIWLSDPADLGWQFYTGTFPSSSAKLFQEKEPAKVGAGWYGYMPGGYNQDADYRYGYWSNGNSWDNPPENKSEYEFYGDKDIEKMTTKLYEGRLESLTQYWNMIQRCTDKITKESVRCFLVTPYEYYVYDKDAIKGAATDVIMGWSDIFTPRTMKTKDGVFKASQYSSRGKMYEGAWNEIQDNSYERVSKQKKMISDPGSALNPGDGEPMPMRMDWTDSEEDAMIERDYQYVDGELYNNIEIPSKAVVYDPFTQSWENVDEDNKSAVKVTYDIELGKWHTGTNLTMADVMGWHAWAWEMSTSGAKKGFYNSEFANKMGPIFDSILGEVWDEENGTLTVYGDYTLPADSKTGAFFSTFPKLHYTQYMAAQWMITEDELAPSDISDYSWDSTGDKTIDWMSKSQGEDIKETLQNMIETDFVPWFMKEENNVPITVSTETLNEKRDALIDFYGGRSHFYASQGPFMIDGVNEEEMKIDIVRFKQEDGYPWPKDHWEDKLSIAELTVSSANVPSSVDRTEKLNVSFDVQVDEDYPNDVTRDVTVEDDASGSIQLLNEAGKLVSQKDANLINSTFKTSFETKSLELGNYTVRFEGKIPEQFKITKTSRPTTITKFEPIKVTDFDMPGYEDVGDLVNINATVNNRGENVTSFDWKINDDVIKQYEVEPGETVEINETFEFSTGGVFKITIAGESKTIHISQLVIDEFSVSDVSIVGEPVHISVNVENNGSGGLTNVVCADDEVLESFTLWANESETLFLEHEFSTPGSHTISVGDEEQTVMIKKAIEIKDTMISKNEVEKGEDVNISVTITNNDNITHDVTVKANDITIHAFNVTPSAEDKRFSMNHSFDEIGKYVIYVGEKKAGHVNVTSSQDTEDPVADAGENKTVSLNEKVTLNGNLSTDNEQITKYIWYIREDVYHSEKITYNFDTLGEHDVELKVVDGSNNSDTDEITVTVVDDTPPVVEAGSDIVVNFGEEIRLDASESHDNVGIKSYQWVLDGTVYEGKIVNITLDKVGDFTANLTVIDEGGNTDSDTVDVKVEDLPEPVFNIHINGEKVTDNSLNFSVAIHDLNRDIESFKWYFGDGANGKNRNVSHEYGEPGNYTVTLDVTFENDDTSTFRKTIKISDDASGGAGPSDGDDGDGTPGFTLMILLFSLSSVVIYKHKKRR